MAPTANFMRVIRGLHNIHLARRASVLSLGNFDGVHRGHQALLSQLAQWGGERGAATTVMCFEPQPLEHLRPDQAPARLQTLAEKLRCLQQHPVDQVVVLPFDRRLASTTAQSFITDILVAALGVQGVLVGEDCRFGHQRLGDLAMLCEFATDGRYSVRVLPTVSDQDSRISSTAVREALQRGDPEQAAAALGRHYSVRGRVVHGQKLGRQLGAATANIAVQATALRHGVYCVRLDGVPSVANLGLRPTIGGDQVVLEVHVLAGAPDLYGHWARVTFEAYLRPEIKFADLDALRVAIATDIQAARTFFRMEAT